MLELFGAGALLMLLILLCSVVARAIKLERWWSLRRAQVLRTLFLARLKDAKGWPTAGNALADLGSTSQLGYVLAVGLANLSLPREEFQQAIQVAWEGAAHDLERHLTGLGLIASIAPLLGILATVVGLIDVFDQLFAAGQTDSQLLTSGILTALVTTAAGLFIAIPALICHRAMLRHVDTPLLKIESVSNQFFELARRQS